MDLTKFPEFHPHVVKVDLLSGKALREPGASYKCHLSGGKHTCIEKDIKITLLRKMVTVLPEDTFGISKILSDYTVEKTFQKVGHQSTKVEISHYDSTTTLKAKILNLIATWKIARETQATLNAAKATIENACRITYRPSDWSGAICPKKKSTIEFYFCNRAGNSWKNSGLPEIPSQWTRETDCWNISCFIDSCVPTMSASGKVRSSN